MANIPLPKTSDVKSATGYQQVDPSTGTAPYRALVGAGGAIAETGKTFHMFAEKRQKLLNDAAESQLDLEMMRANGEIDEYALKNQQDPDSIRTFADERLGRVWDGVDRKKVDGEAYQLLNQKYAHQAERTKIGVNGKVTQMEVQNANAVFFNQAEAMRRAGNPQAAFDALKKMSVSDAELHDKMETIFSEGVSFEVGSRIQSAYNSTDIEQLEMLKEELEAKGDDGRYSAYEYTINHNGQDVAAGGLSIGARRQSIKEIGSKISRLEVSSIKAQRKAIKTYYKEDIMQLDPNLPIDVRESLEDIRIGDVGKLGMSSGEFMQLQRQIVEEQSLYFEDENHSGMKESDRKKLWKSIESAGLSESAQMALVRRMLSVEELRAGRDKIRGSRMKGFFVDLSIPAFKQKIQESLVSRYTREADLIIEGLGEGRSSEPFLGFLEAMDELEQSLEGLDEKDAEKFIKTDVPALWNRHMSKATQEALDNIMFK